MVADPGSCDTIIAIVTTFCSYMLHVPVHLRDAPLATAETPPPDERLTKSGVLLSDSPVKKSSSESSSDSESERSSRANSSSEEKSDFLGKFLWRLPGSLDLRDDGGR